MKEGYTLHFKMPPFKEECSAVFNTIPSIRLFVEHFCTIDRQTVRITSKDGKRTYDMYKDEKTPAPEGTG